MYLTPKPTAMPIATSLPKLRDSIKRPPPRWFRITKKITSYTTNFVLGILMINGHRADDIILLEIKLAQSFAMDVLDELMSNGEVYADVSQVKPEELVPVVEVKPVDK